MKTRVFTVYTDLRLKAVIASAILSSASNLSTLGRPSLMRLVLWILSEMIVNGQNGTEIATFPKY